MRNVFLAAAGSLGLLAPVFGASAASFTGSATAKASVAFDPSCQPFANFRGKIAPGNGPGTSNFGAFDYTHNVCTQGAVTPVSLQQGTFAIAFADGGIFGTFTGTTTPTATPGLNDQVFAYVITGGTGRYLGASGGFGNIGTVDTRKAPPSLLTLNFDGDIFAPGVPEPATWAMLVVGFGLVGHGLRSRRRTPVRLAYD